MGHACMINSDKGAEGLWSVNILDFPLNFARFFPWKNQLYVGENPVPPKKNPV